MGTPYRINKILRKVYKRIHRAEIPVQDSKILAHDPSIDHENCKLTTGK